MFARTVLGWILALSCCLSGPCLRAEEPAQGPAELEGLSGAAMLDLVRALAADEMRGRKTAFEGGRLAEDWVAARFAEFGLKPADSGGTYLEPFTFGASNIEAPIRLAIAGKALEYGTDYNDLSYTGAGKVKGEIAFCGYGIHRPDLGWDDYEGVDVKGRIVLAIRGAPTARATEFSVERQIGAKSSVAREKGAVGFLLVEGDAAQSGTIQERFYRADLPSLWVSARVADVCLQSKGRTFAQEKAERDAGTRGTSILTGVEAEMEVNATFEANAVGHNALGMLAGRDPDLREEVLVIGAHMDHLGIDAAGRVYNGADDNASGTAMLVHLADILTQNRWRPKRTIVFCAFGAEEQGLVGSRALAARYPFQGRIVCVLNTDMVGQGEAAVALSGGGGYPAMEGRLRAALPDAWRPSVHFELRTGANSDHWPFHERGIPAFFMGTRGAHPNYHTSLDDVEAIRPECLEAAARAMGAFIVALGDDPEPLTDAFGRARYALREGPRFARAVFDSTLRCPSAPDGTPGAVLPESGVDARSGVSALVVDVPDGSAAEAWAHLSTRSDAKDSAYLLVRRAADIGAAWQAGRTALVPRVVSEGLMPVDRLQALAALGYRWVAPFGEPADEAQATALGKVALARGILLDVTPLGVATRAAVRKALGNHPVVAFEGRVGTEDVADPHLLVLSEGAAALASALEAGGARGVFLDAAAEPGVLAALGAYLAGEGGAQPEGDRRQRLRSLLGGALAESLRRAEK